ncbi:MAG: rhomboid family intramembrane serine protease [Vicinamibacterales bacterium]
MILPLGDTPNPRGVPYVTYAVIGFNCLVYLLWTLPLSGMVPDPRDPALVDYINTIGPLSPQGTSVRQLLTQTTRYDLFVFEHGYRPSNPDVGDLFASLFLHGGLMHLFGNMLFLWIYGDNVEQRLGRLRFLIWYLVTGVAATLFHSLFSARSPIPLVGASGAISGVLGFYFLWFPHNRVRLWVFLFPLLMDTFLVPARLVLGMYLFIDNLLPFLFSGGGGGGVAYGAHLGGFIAGVGAAWFMRRRAVERAPEDYPQTAIAEPTRSVAEDIADAAREGRYADAAQMYFAVPSEKSRRLMEPRTSLELARWLAEQRHGQAALIVYQRHLRDFPAGPGLAEAHLGAGLVQLYLMQQPAAAYQHLVDALDNNPDALTAGRAREALQVIGDMQKRAPFIDR